MSDVRGADAGRRLARLGALTLGLYTALNFLNYLDRYVLAAVLQRLKADPAFAGTSDAAIVSGLIAMLLRVYSGRSPAEIAATDPKFLKELGLLEALSTNRGNGIAAMARKVREVAALSAAQV